jgi:hypothetical protein
MENVRNPKIGDQRKGERRQSDEDSAFEGPNRRKAERRAESSTARERHVAQGR